MFRRNRAIHGIGRGRRLLVWLAIAVQLHLFLVAELHHHVLNLFIEESQYVAHQPGPNVVPFPALPLSCPACQIARQGSINPSANIRVSDPCCPQLEVRQIHEPATVFTFRIVRSGRDPPLFS